MARSRIIKPAFFEDQKVSKLSLQARIMYVGIWTLLDRTGVGEFTPVKIKNFIFGYDQDVTIPQVEKWFQELITHGFMQQFDLRGQELYYCPNFKKHQRFHQREQSQYEEKQILDALAIQAHPKHIPGTVEAHPRCPTPDSIHENMHDAASVPQDTPKTQPHHFGLLESAIEKLMPHWDKTYTDKVWLETEINKARTYLQTKKIPGGVQVDYWINQWVARGHREKNQVKTFEQKSKPVDWGKVFEEDAS